MKKWLGLGVLTIVFGLRPAEAAEPVPQADLHVAVYSSGFLVDTRSLATYGNGARRVEIKTQTQGTAKGEAPDSVVEIDRITEGVQYRLDPKTKTYSQSTYLASRLETTRPPTAPSKEPPSLKISKIDPTVSGPLGSAVINGLPCQSYTIRIVADFTYPQSGKVVATETLLEKLWVTEKAPPIEAFRKVETQFRDTLSTAYGSEKANFRWLVREFNKHILEMNGNTEDFKSLQMTYQGARASIKGVTVRQLAGWNWRPKDASAPGADAGNDMNSFIGAIAAGLGAPPETEGKTPMADSEKPRWVQDLEKDLGRSGPTAMILDEVLKTRTVLPDPALFDVPKEYKRNPS